MKGAGETLGKGGYYERYNFSSCNNRCMQGSQGYIEKKNKKIQQYK